MTELFLVMKRRYLSNPVDLFGAIERNYYATLYTSTTRESTGLSLPGKVLVSKNRPFSDYREALAYADYYSTEFFGDHSEHIIVDIGFSYYENGTDLVHVNGDDLTGLLDQYWDRYGERQVSRFFEEGLF